LHQAWNCPFSDRTSIFDVSLYPPPVTRVSLGTGKLMPRSKVKLESQALSHGSCCAKVESRNADSRHVSPSDCRYNSRTINRTTGHVAMIINCIFCFFTIHIIVSNIFTQALSLRIGVQDILQLCIVLHNKYIDPLPSKGVEYSKTCNSFLQSIWFCFWEHLR
jgi:hypothetical protein